jgi:hypothetical protein
MNLPHQDKRCPVKRAVVASLADLCTGKVHSFKFVLALVMEDSGAITTVVCFGRDRQECETNE